MRRILSTRHLSNRRDITADFKIFDETDRRIIDIRKPLNKAVPDLNKILRDKFGVRFRK